jgi:hypothetical protein
VRVRDLGPAMDAQAIQQVGDQIPLGVLPIRTTMASYAWSIRS